MEHDIDFVILWVDGSDPNWIKEKKKFLDPHNEVDQKIQYRDWDNLQYWFRGVEKFAPWVRKIHFVTYGHYPKWLNIRHKKINLVRHEDFIPHGYLPLFCSKSIEVNVHKIKDLSEKFVLFNDDMFLTDHISPSTFFKNELPCDMPVMVPILSPKIRVFDHTLLNNIALINQNFQKKSVIKSSKYKWFNCKYGLKYNLLNLFYYNFPDQQFPGFKLRHLPQPYLKSIFSEVWNKGGDVLDDTAKRKFRDNYQVNHYLFRYWQFSTGSFFPHFNKNEGKNFSLPSKSEELLQSIKRQEYKMICANDTSDFEFFSDLVCRVKQAFNEILPEKSKFEL